MFLYHFSQCVWHCSHYTDRGLDSLALPPWYRHIFNHAPDNSVYCTPLLTSEVGHFDNWRWNIWNVKA